MSCDFGPIPAPQSPIQDYFERMYRTSSNISPAAPVTSPAGEHGSIAEQLSKALADLKKKQDDESTSTSAEIGFDEERRGSSATSTGYAAMQAITGLFQRRTLPGSDESGEKLDRRPSR